MAAKHNKKATNKNAVIAIVVVVVLLAIALGVCLSVEKIRTPLLRYVDQVLMADSGETNNSQGGSTAEQNQNPPKQEQGGSGQKPQTTPTVYEDVTTYVGTPTLSADQLSVHFLELGNRFTGDCTLLKIGDTEVLIDAGSKQSSAATTVPYISQYCTDGKLEYVIATHAHEDHIAGLVGTVKNKGVLASFEIGTIIEFAGTKKTYKEGGQDIYSMYCAARNAAVDRGATCYTALQCWQQTDGASRAYTLADGVTMEILYNYYYDHPTPGKEDENNYSVCILVTAGDKHYLFTGDLEAEGEHYLVQNNSLPHVDLFKAGHHGSYTANTEELMAVIQPKVVCVCCCCGTFQYTSEVDSKNNFPAQDFFDHVLPYTDLIFVTSMLELPQTDDLSSVKFSQCTVTSCNGNIVVLSDLTIYCSARGEPITRTDWYVQNRKRKETGN